MDILEFKARYPQFTDDVQIAFKVQEAEKLLPTFNIEEKDWEIAMQYMVAHLLTLAEQEGASEPIVTRVKADNVEVSFSDRVNPNNWLYKTSYGQLFLMLIKARIKEIGMLVV